MSEHGARTRAGKLLSKYIRQIAEEPTEFLKGENGVDDKMVTKAEYLARLIWKNALGFTEKRMVANVVTDVIHSPDKGCMGLIFDRMEGRAPLMVGEGDDKLTVSERVSEQGKKRIAQAGGMSDNSD